MIIYIHYVKIDEHFYLFNTIYNFDIKKLNNL